MTEMQWLCFVNNRKTRLNFRIHIVSIFYLKVELISKGKISHFRITTPTAMYINSQFSTKKVLVPFLSQLILKLLINGWFFKIWKLYLSYLCSLPSQRPLTKEGPRRGSVQEIFTWIKGIIVMGTLGTLLITTSQKCLLYTLSTQKNFQWLIITAKFN